MRRWQGASHHALQNTLGLGTGALRAPIIVAMEGMHKRMYWECGLSSSCGLDRAQPFGQGLHLRGALVSIIVILDLHMAFLLVLLALIVLVLLLLALHLSFNLLFILLAATTRCHGSGGSGQRLATVSKQEVGGCGYICTAHIEHGL